MTDVWTSVGRDRWRCRCGVHGLANARFHRCHSGRAQHPLTGYQLIRRSFRVIWMKRCRSRSKILFLQVMTKFREKRRGFLTLRTRQARRGVYEVHVARNRRYHRPRRESSCGGFRERNPFGVGWRGSRSLPTSTCEVKFSWATYTWTGRLSRPFSTLMWHVRERVLHMDYH